MVSLAYRREVGMVSLAYSTYARVGQAAYVLALECHHDRVRDFFVLVYRDLKREGVVSACSARVES